MKKTILLLAMLILSAYSASAYYADYSNYQHIPTVNPYYANYYDTYGFTQSQKYRNAVETSYYQQLGAPYILVSSPYGKRPWHKPYGDNYLVQETQEAFNPFYGFPYIRQYHCHGPNACHNHNIFPDSHHMVPN
ncbi:hypothetical protein ACFL1B_03380 [Nanoarchaeota archaeon]